MSMIKKFAAAAVAVACAVGITGCDSKAKEFAGPKVAEGTIFAMAARPAEETSLAPLFKKYGLDSSNDISQFPDELKDVIKKLELDKAEFKWFSVTVGDVSAAAKGEDVPDAAIALASNISLDKVVAVVQEKLKDVKSDDKPEFKKTTIAEVPAYEVHSKEFKAGKKTVVPCLASLEGKLIIGAMSAAGIEKQIALYREGKGESADFSSFALAKDDVVRIKAVKVGENVKKSIPDPEMLKGLGAMIPDGDKLVLGLGNVELVLGASADGKNVTANLTVETSADADADKLCTLVKTGVMGITAPMKQAAEKYADAKLAYGALQAVKVEPKGKVATLTFAYSADEILKFVGEKAKAAK